MNQPMSTNDVKNYKRPTNNCVFDTVISAMHAAITVPKPGINKLKMAATTATGFVTNGTLETSNHTCLSRSSTTITFYCIWFLTASLAFSLSMPPPGLV